MENFFTLKLTRQSSIPVYKQLADNLEEMIRQNILKPGTKLPSIRKMSHKLGINDVTVISAYKYLENKNILVSQVGSGTYVSEITTGYKSNPNSLEYKPPLNIDIRNAINFSKSTIIEDLFMISEFKHLFNEILEIDGIGAFSFTPGRGYKPLRQYLQHYIASYEVKISYERIQIMSDIHRCIDVLSKTMLNKGDYVLTESPSQNNIINIFKQNLCKVIRIPMCREGIDLKRLEKYIKKYKPKLLYINPYFQTPTSITYSQKTKEEIIILSNKYNIYILEEDTSSDLLSDYKAKPLKAFDTDDRVILIKSFSKFLPSGLNMCFVTLPNHIYLPENLEIGICSIIQRVIELYFRKGYFANSLIKIKNTLKPKYELMKSAINLNLADYVDYNAPLGGLYFWLEIKDKNTSAKRLCERLLSKGVIITPGTIFSHNHEDIPYMRLCIANANYNEIKKGISMIKNEFENIKHK